MPFRHWLGIRGWWSYPQVIDSWWQGFIDCQQFYFIDQRYFFDFFFKICHWKTFVVLSRNCVRGGSYRYYFHAIGKLFIGKFLLFYHAIVQFFIEKFLLFYHAIALQCLIFFKFLKNYSKDMFLSLLIRFLIKTIYVYFSYINIFYFYYKPLYFMILFLKLLFYKKIAY